MVEELIAEENKNQEQWYLVGYCEVCKLARKFMLDWRYSDGITPNYRERILCPVCGLNNRQRFMMRLLSDLLEEQGVERQAIYCYEQATRFYDALVAKYRTYEVTGSEYLGFRYKSGDIYNGVRHEDAQCLSFDNETLDIIISNDVFEHIPDIEVALSESFRVLKEGGKLLLCIPFHSDRYNSVKRAELVDGELRYILPEQFHGNPLSFEGSLVFHDFGWDFLDSCRNAGYSNAYVIGYNSLLFGYLGGLQLMVCAEK
jgi:SAM-dependent methyltransferase